MTLLPLSPNELENAKCKVLAALQEGGLSRDESEIKLEADFTEWLDGSQSTLAESTLGMLEDAPWFSRLEKPRERTPGKLYERIVKRLSEQASISRRTAAITVSYLPLMIHLVQEFQLSAAGVAEVLNESDRRLLLHWKGIEKILGELKLGQTLEDERVQSLIRDDRKAMCDSFLDADLPTIIEILASESDLFELGARFHSSLNDLLVPGHGEAIVPYLQTLFYLCVITEYYDHPLEYLYTFKPRGNVANAIFEVFPSVMASTGNPILNNFKAIDRLSHDWARSRDDYPMQAQALVDIVFGLSSLSYSSRRYLAGKIRAGLLKFIEIKTPQALIIPEVTSLKEIRELIALISAEETNTKGVIEQRVCDFLSQLIYPQDEWRPRGLSDPVNATNTASLKLGDVDFQRVEVRRCAAIEAHAGKLTPVYLQEHFRTLRKNLSSRMEEWKRIADLNEWKLDMVFVVHENACTNDNAIPGVTIDNSLEILTYREFSERAMLDRNGQEEEIISLFNEFVVGVLNRDNVPHQVKQTMISLLSPC